MADQAAKDLAANKGYQAATADLSVIGFVPYDIRTQNALYVEYVQGYANAVDLWCGCTTPFEGVK